jgi:hypothetical protein
MSRPQPRLISIAEHPRAGASVRRWKSWGGLVAFALTLTAGLLGGVETWTAVGRALAGGVVGYLAVWAAALAFWRHVLHAEARAVMARVAARRSGQNGS